MRGFFCIPSLSNACVQLQQEQAMQALQAKKDADKMEMYKKMDFDLAQYHEDAGVNGISDQLLYKTKAEILMHRTLVRNTQIGSLFFHLLVYAWFCTAWYESSFAFLDLRNVIL